MNKVYYGDPENWRDKLNEAISSCSSLNKVTGLYIRYVVASIGSKLQAADKLRVDRRTVQRWMKEEGTGA